MISRAVNDTGMWSRPGTRILKHVDFVDCFWLVGIKYKKLAEEMLAGLVYLRWNISMKPFTRAMSSSFNQAVQLSMKHLRVKLTNQILIKKKKFYAKIVWMQAMALEI